LQTNPCIRHKFSTQVFRKRAAQLHYVGPELRYIILASIFWPPLEGKCTCSPWQCCSQDLQTEVQAWYCSIYCEFRENTYQKARENLKMRSFIIHTIHKPSSKRSNQWRSQDGPCSMYSAKSIQDFNWMRTLGAYGRRRLEKI